MSKSKLEERVALLESRVEQLSHEIQAHGENGSKDWRLAITKYAGDDDIQAVFAEAMKLRMVERARIGRSKNNKK